MRNFSKFSRVNVSSINELEMVIKQYLIEGTINSDIFNKTGGGQAHTPVGPGPIPPVPPGRRPGPNPRAIMDAMAKFNAIKEMLSRLRAEYPRIDISQVLLGTEKYEDYIVFPLDDTNITLFENFKNKSNTAIYIVKKDDVSSVVRKTRTETRNQFDEEHVNHPSDPSEYGTYVDNLTQKTNKMIRLTSKPSKTGTLVGRSKSRLDAFMERQAKAKIIQSKSNEMNKTNSTGARV